MNEEQSLLDDDFNEKNHLKTIYTISLQKFIFLYIITLGLYGFWWTYKTWRFFKERENSDINPIARALFAIFFHYDLISRIQNFAQEKNYNNIYQAGMLTFGFIACNFISYLPEPLNFISITSFVFLIPPFNAWNYAIEHADDVKAIQQTGFSGRHIAVVVIGIIIWILTIMSINEVAQI